MRSTEDYLLGVVGDNDHEFEEHVLTAVDPHEDGGYTLHFGSMMFSIDNADITPRQGMKVRMYGKGFGYPVRGVIFMTDIPSLVYYRTAEQQAVHHKESLYGKDCEDLLRRWDAGEGVFSVSMGGLGPGYEQVIQMMGFEMLRYFMAKHLNFDELDGAKWRAFTDQMDETFLKPMLDQIGPSGAQYNAAINLATVFYRNGPIRAHEMLDEKDQGDRSIRVSRNFPTFAGKLTVPA